MQKLNPALDVPKRTPGERDRRACSFSIVIPALNEEHVIGKCLDSIIQLDYPAQQLEVIIVDNGSTDRTREITESYRPVLNISVLLRPDVNISALRNSGAAVATGDYFAFLDADVAVRPDWLRNAEQVLVSSGIQLIGGFYEVPENSSWVARGWFDRKVKGIDFTPSYLPSGNLLLSRADFLRIGGFDESLKTSEDCDFSYRARSLGLKLAQYHSLSAVHLGSPQTTRAFFRREVWHGTSVFRVFLRNLHQFQNSKAVLFAIYTLLCLIMTIVGAIVAGYGNPRLFFLFAALLLLGPLALAVAAAHRTRWQQFPTFYVLFLLYGCARAISLVFLLIGKRVSGRRAVASAALSLNSDTPNRDNVRY